MSILYQTLYTNELSDNNKNILQALYHEDPALFSPEVLNAIQYLSNNNKISLVDFPKIQILGTLLIFKRLKNETNRQNNIKSLSVFISALNRYQEFPISTSRLIEILTGLASLTITLSRNDLSFSKEVTVVMNNKFEKDLNRSYVSTDQCSTLSAQKNKILNSTNARISADIRYNDIQAVGYLQYSTELVYQLINLQENMFENAKDLNLNQTAFLNIPLNNLKKSRT